MENIHTAYRHEKPQPLPDNRASHTGNSSAAALFVDRLRDEYIENHKREQVRDELIAENNIEKRDVRGYHGREIFELLQNADDAYQKSIDLGCRPACDLEVRICYKGNSLTISNSGTFFDNDGIKAIVQGNNSPKSGKYLGNKGTGFRSILNWANSVRIYSGDFAVEFSRLIAHEVLESISNEPQIKRQLRSNPSLYIPMLAVPKNICHDRDPELTTIELELDPAKLNDGYSVEHQLDELDMSILLFLPNIAGITVETESGTTRLWRSVSPAGACASAVPGIEESDVIVGKDTGDSHFKKRYSLFRKTIPHAAAAPGVEKDINLAVAVASDAGDRPQHLYSYFPLLDTESPFDCLMHATYDLGDHRNTINKCNANIAVAREQLAMIVEVAITFVARGDLQTAYRLLLPRNAAAFGDDAKAWRFASAFSQLKLEDYYIGLLARKPLFRTVAGRMVSVEDSPRLIGRPFPKAFKGEAFRMLLEHDDDSCRDRLIALIAGRLDIDLAYTPVELCEVIDSVSGLWNIKRQAKVFVWWNVTNPFRSSGLLPELLADKNGNTLKAGQQYYFLEGHFEDLEIPTWVDTPCLSDTSQEALVARAKKVFNLNKTVDGRPISAVRQICQEGYFPCVDFSYRDRSNIVATVNASVRDNYDHAIDFARWLFRFYRQSWESTGKPADLVLRFPAADHTVANSNMLYFSRVYGNELADRLFGKSRKALASPAAIAVEADERLDFMQFARLCGVCDFPTVEVVDIDPMPGYAQIIRREIEAAEHTAGPIGMPDVDYSLEYIENLRQLLESLPTADILQWISADKQLFLYLHNPYSLKSEINYQLRSQRKKRRLNGNIPNYILHVFDNTPWIEIDGTRYAPAQVLNGFTFPTNERVFKGHMPVMGKDDIAALAKRVGIGIECIEDIMQSFAFAINVTDLPSADFYGLMLKLPGKECQAAINIYKTIYRIVEQPAFVKTFGASANKTAFFDHGQLLVRHDGQQKICPVAEAMLPSTRIVNKQKYKIVDKGQRTNNVNFTRIFGCLEKSNDYQVVKGSARRAPIDSKFQQRFGPFMRYVRPYSERNDNIAKCIGRLAVTLVTQITVVEDNGSTETVTAANALVKSDINNWYIVVGQVYDALNVNQLSENIETIFDNIANTPKFDAGKLGELFRAGSDEDRDFLTRKEFGTLAVLDLADNTDHRAKCFVDTAGRFIGNCASQIDLNDYDIDLRDPGADTNMPAIVRLFKDLGIDIDDFNGGGYIYGLDITGYNRSQLQVAVRDRMPLFAHNLYRQAQSDESLQQRFVDLLSQFETFADTVDISNSIRFSPEDVLAAEFSQWLADAPQPSGALLDLQAIYKANYSAMNPDSLFADEIAYDTQAQCMIYFCRTDEFKQWLEDAQRRADTDAQKHHNDRYARYRNVTPAETTLPGAAPGHSNDSDENDETSRQKSGSMPRGQFSQKRKHDRETRLKHVGNLGELLVYNHLCKKYGADSVKPRSEAFVELGLLAPGQAKSGDYDLSYTDSDGIEVLIEVKTGTGNRFYMSPGELAMAKSVSLEYNSMSRRVYKVAYVYDYDTPDPKITFLPDRFWDDPRFTAHDIIERTEFSF